MLAVGPTAAAALPKVYRYLRPPTRTVIGATRWPTGWMANVVGMKPIRWSTRLGMTELKKVSSTRCADAVAGASRKAATKRAGQRIIRVDQRAVQASNGLRPLLYQHFVSSAPRETRTPTPLTQDKALNLARLPNSATGAWS